MSDIDEYTNDIIENYLQQERLIEIGRIPNKGLVNPDFNNCVHLARRYKTLQASNEEYKQRIVELEKGLDSVSKLIEDSDGVYGLHLNGDNAPWNSLTTGGQFEEWLVDFDNALPQPPQEIEE